MNVRTKERAWLAGAAAGVMLALLMLPASSGLVRLQLAGVLGMRSALDMDAAESTAVAASHPNDYQIQMAAASSPDVSRLSALEDKFPDNPAVYAEAVRLLSAGSPIRNRPEEYLITGDTPPVKRDRSNNAPFPYAFYDKSAAAGERLDPDNAYFPLMRAAGLFGNHQDSAALAAIHRASLESSWHEYYDDEVRGNWKISELHGAPPSAIMHIAAAAAVLFPDLGRMRSIARIALYKAMLAERSGDPQTGIGIRTDMIRCGSLMRAKSPSLIGCLVGIAIVHVMAANPGGPVVRYENLPGKDRSAAKMAAYLTYLQSNGDGSLVVPITREDEADGAVKGIVGPGVESMTRDLAALALFWVGDTFLLANILVLLIAAMITSGISRWFDVGRPRPLSYPYRVAIFADLVIALVLLGVNISETSDVEYVAGAVGLAGLLIALLPLFRNRSLYSGRTVLKIAAVMAVFAVIVTAATAGLAFETKTGLNFYRLVFASSEENSIQPSPFLSLLAFCPLLLVALISMVVSIIRRVPIVIGTIVGVKAAAAPVACVLILVYGVMFVKTMGLERVNNLYAEQEITREGPALAERIGQPWPAATDWGTVR